jgi:hypothetical protein
MNFRSLLFSLFIVVSLGFGLLAQAEDAKAARGPKITNKVKGKKPLRWL